MRLASDHAARRDDVAGAGNTAKRRLQSRHSAEVCRNTNAAGGIAAYFQGCTADGENRGCTAAASATGTQQIIWVIGAPINQIVRFIRKREFGCVRLSQD